MNNKGLSVKWKVIIIILYTIVIFGAILLFFGTTKDKRFNEYGDKSYDNYLGINLRVSETRKSLYETGSNNKKGEHEKSNWDVQVYLIKLKAGVTVSNIKIYLAVKAENGTYRYQTYESGTGKSISSQTFGSWTAWSNVLTTEYKTVSDETKLFDETPREFYVKVTYTIQEKDETKTSDHILNYHTEALNYKNEKEFKKVDTRTVIKENANKIDSKNDPINMKIEKKLATEKTTLKEVQQNSYQITTTINLPNLALYKYNEEVLKKDRLIEVEIPQDQTNEDAWNIYPELPNTKIEVYAKTKKEDKDFSEYVNIVSFYGFYSRYRTINSYAISLDESFDVEEFYIIIEGEFLHGTTNQGGKPGVSCAKTSKDSKFKIKYKVNLDDLPTYN